MLAKDGWFLVGIARRIERLKELKEELGASFLPVMCDVRKTIDIKNSSDYLKKQNITPALFFLNAGCGEIEDKFYTDVHIKTFETNYFGAIKWIEEWLPKHELCTTTFVSMSSLITVHSTPRSSAYCASKSALKSYFESLRLQ